MSKTCTVCGKGIDPRSVSGLCKPHFMHHLNNDPAATDQRRAAQLAWAKNNPEALRRRSAKIWAARRANPDDMAALAERMRTVCQPASCTAESIARRDSAKRALSISRARNPWCPDEYRAEYLALVRHKQLTGAEARAVIEAQIKADNARLSPFERQERALRNGAALQDNQRIDRHSQSAAELRQKLA